MANVFITGCSSGFGLLTAVHFARRGDRVFATLRAPARADALHGAIVAERLPITVLRLDVCDQASIDAAVGQAHTAGPIDVLINNAGIELRSSIEDAAESARTGTRGATSSPRTRRTLSTCTATCPAGRTRWTSRA